MKIRDPKTKEKFIQYLKENPELRFWQAVRNFSEYYAIFGYKGKEELWNLKLPEGMVNTFFIESDEKY